jgi:hypothetical protein
MGSSFMAISSVRDKVYMKDQLKFHIISSNKKITEEK